MVSTRLVAEATKYRARRHASRRGGPDAEDFVRVMYDSYRGRRTRRIMAILGALERINETSDTIALEDEDARAEAWELAVGEPQYARATAEVRAEHLQAWREALFNVLARNALNAGEWVGDLQLRNGQEAVVVESDEGTEIGLTAPTGPGPSPFQVEALNTVAMVRAATVAHEHAILVDGNDAARLPQLVLEAFGMSESDLAHLAATNPFGDLPMLDVALPLVMVSCNDTLIVCEQVEPWQAIANAQERGASFGDAIAAGVLMMSADSGIALIPPEVITPDGVAAIIERDRQEARIAMKLSRWTGLTRDAIRRKKLR